MKWNNPFWQPFSKVDMRYNFIYKNKTHGIDAKKLTKPQMIKGLMFKSKEKAKALLFQPAVSIHSYFVRFPFLAVWINENDKAVKIEKIKPFTFRVARKSNSKLLEIPINKEYKDLVKELGF